MNNEELRSVVHQFNTGCVSAIEFLLRVQLSPTAVANLLLAQKLPAAAQAQIDIGSLMKSDDEVIEEPAERQAYARRTYAGMFFLAGYCKADERDSLVFYRAADDFGIKFPHLQQAKNFSEVLPDSSFVIDGNIIWTAVDNIEQAIGPFPDDFAPTLWTGEGKQHTPSSKQKYLKAVQSKWRDFVNSNSKVKPRNLEAYAIENVAIEMPFVEFLFASATLRTRFMEFMDDNTNDASITGADKKNYNFANQPCFGVKYLLRALPAKGIAISSSLSAQILSDA